MAGLAHYYSRYDHEHRHPGNKLLHGVGIPVIIAGMALGALTLWKVGLAMFAAGWLLLFLGHRLEGNHPAFFQGPVYFLVGPLWVGRELKQWLMSRSPLDLAQDKPLRGRQANRPPSARLSQSPPGGLMRVGRQIKQWLLSPPARSAGRGQ